MLGTLGRGKCDTGPPVYETGGSNCRLVQSREILLRGSFVSYREFHYHHHDREGLGVFPVP